MTKIKYRITNVDTGLGYLQIEIILPNGIKDLITIEMISIFTSQEDTEEQVKIVLDDFVRRRCEELMPKPIPIPMYIDRFRGKSFEIDV